MVISRKLLKVIEMAEMDVISDELPLCSRLRPNKRNTERPPSNGSSKFEKQIPKAHSAFGVDNACRVDCSGHPSGG